MDIEEAQKCVARERGRWFLLGLKAHDDELMRRRVRLYNGFTMALAIGAFAGVTFVFPNLLGAEVWTVYLGGALCVLTAWRCGALADECREVRQLLAKRGVRDVASALRFEA